MTGRPIGVHGGLDGPEGPAREGTEMVDRWTQEDRARRAKDRAWLALVEAVEAETREDTLRHLSTAAMYRRAAVRALSYVTGA